MRRPQTLDWSPHHSYCCQALIEGGQPGDIRLVQICQLLKLSQDVSRTFCYDTRPKSPLPTTPHLSPLYTDSVCSRTIRPVRLSHRKRLPSTPRNLARPKPFSRPIRLHLVPPHKPLSPRSFSPLLPFHRRPSSTLRI